MAVSKKSRPKHQARGVGGSRRKSSKRKPGGRFGGRFWKAACTSAIASFLAFSHWLNPGWLEQYGFKQLDLGRFIPVLAEQEFAPLLGAQGERVHTTFTRCPQFFPGATPRVPAGAPLRELCFSSFAILHNGKTKTPVFVVERLNRRTLSAASNISRTDRFYAEARLPQAERAELSDYRGSGYSRGHMAPAGDMSSDEAMAQSFSLANMVPQNQTHNAGAWNKIESDTRKYVMRAKGDVYVFTGPLYRADVQTIGEGRVAVPSYLYKLVYDAGSGSSWVYWQANRADARVGPPISYDEFLSRTGLQLLPGKAN